MTDRYDGPAALRLDDGRTFEVEAKLATHVDDLQIRTWEGSATAADIGVLRAALGQGGALVLPDGREGEVHVVDIQVRAGQPGVLVRLHGAGAAPYGDRGLDTPG